MCPNWDRYMNSMIFGVDGNGVDGNGIDGNGVAIVSELMNNRDEFPLAFVKFLR